MTTSGHLHVDGRSDGQHEPTHPGVHLVLGLQQVDGHGQGGAARAGPESRGESIGHVGNKLEGKGSGNQGVDCW